MTDWETIFTELNRIRKKTPLPSVSLIGEEDRDPYKILVSTIISLRTRDEVTLSASRKLFEKAPGMNTLAGLTAEEIAGCIYPAGFYRVKSENLLTIARFILNEKDGQIPSDLSGLLALPGVGLKTANLVLSLGFGIPAICVDTHVHRIANRMGWIRTKKPDDSVAALEKVLPRQYWITINELLVLYGQQICTPLSPRCSLCRLKEHCRRMGVERSR